MVHIISSHFLCMLLFNHFICPNHFITYQRWKLQDSINESGWSGWMKTIIFICICIVCIFAFCICIFCNYLKVWKPRDLITLAVRQSQGHSGWNQLSGISTNSKFVFVLNMFVSFVLLSYMHVLYAYIFDSIINSGSATIITGELWMKPIIRAFHCF